jgi:hypothetical protein
MVTGVRPDTYRPAGCEDRERVDPDMRAGLPAAGYPGQVDDLAVAEVDAVVVNNSWAAGADVVAAP